MNSLRIARPGVFDIVSAALFGVFTLPLSVFIATSGSAWLGAAASVLITIVITAAMIAVVVLAKGNPALALGIAWGAAVVQMAAGLPPLPADLAVFGVLFWTGVGPGRHIRIAGAVSVVVATIAVTIYLQAPTFVYSPSPSVAFGVALVLVAALVSFALAWTLGLLFATARAGRAERQEAIVEQERGRIAREMHDVVAHSLAVIIAQADGARYASVNDPDLARDGLETVAGIARSALGDVRVLLAGLRHREATGPQPTLDDLGAVIEQVRAAGLAVDVTADEAPVGLPVGVQLAAHRIVQESLTNALRHGRHDRPATVEIRWSATEGTIVVSSWVDSARPPSGVAGHGITGMRERARIAGGELTITADERFVVRASLPISSVGATAEPANGASR